jgi:hypothetical protein
MIRFKTGEPNYANDRAVDEPDVLRNKRFLRMSIVSISIPSPAALLSPVSPSA